MYKMGVGYKQRREGQVFKNIVIGILAVSTLGFMWLAIRNAQPLPCDAYDYISDPDKTICLIHLVEGSAQR